METKQKTTGKTEADGKTSTIDLIDDGKNKVSLSITEIKESRVVLNLTTEQAKELSHFCQLDGVAKGATFEHYKLAQTISKRIDRTILKQAYIARCKADGLGKPSKAQMQGFMEDVK